MKTQTAVGVAAGEPLQILTVDLTRSWADPGKSILRIVVQS
jgi:hypothetical protein